MAEALKLAVEDADDLTALSALLQDAVLRVGDMAFLPKARRFALVLNRYRWEAADPRGRGERIRAGLRIENVAAAKAQRIRQDAPDAVLSLLSLIFVPLEGESGADGGGTLTLHFSGGGAIALQVEALELQLDDLAGPWPAKGRPEHALD